MSDGRFERLRATTKALMAIPGLAGHEDRVRRAIANDLAGIGLTTRTDRLGNLIATIAGDPGAPSVMLFAHMDQLGFVVRKIDPAGFLWLERVGGVPEKAMPGQAVTVCVAEGRDVAGVIANKSHHATGPDEKYTVAPTRQLYVDIGADSAADVRSLGIEIGAPVVYAPAATDLGAHRLTGTAIDDRAGCAVVIEAARAIAADGPRPTLHVVFAVLEEFNLRGAKVAAQALHPDIAIQIDLTLPSDTPDMGDHGAVALAGGPVMSLYSFHGRGTLNGTIPHPALTNLFSTTAAAEGIALQRIASTGLLTDSSYVQLVGDTGVACIDLAFPCRYTHSPRELCDLRDLDALTALVIAGLRRMTAKFDLDRDAYT